MLESEEYNSDIDRAAAFVSRMAVRVIFAAAAVLVTWLIMRYCFAFGRSLFYSEPAAQPPGTDVEIYVEAGESLNELADELMRKGVVTDARALKVQGILYETSLYPGEYTLNTSMTTKEILKKISSTADKLEEAGETATKETRSDESEVSGGYEGDEYGADEAMTEEINESAESGGMEGEDPGQDAGT